MADLVKNAMYSGVGAVSLAFDKLQSVVDELIEQEKLSNKEGKKLMEEFNESLEDKKGELEGQIKKLTEDLSKKFDFKKKNELGNIKERIERLENEWKHSGSIMNETANDEKVSKKVVRKKAQEDTAE